MQNLIRGLSFSLLTFALAACQGPTDTAGPQVLSTQPENGATGIAVNRMEMTVTFDEAIDPATLDTTTLHAYSLTTGIEATLTGVDLDATGMIATAHLTGELEGLATYTLTVEPSVTDLNGNYLQGNQPDGRHQTTFTTAAGPDRTAPTWIGATPTFGEMNADPTQPIVLEFSEPVRLASPSAMPVQVSDVTAAIASIPGTLSCDGPLCTFNAADGLLPQHDYRVTLSAGVTDLSGNPVSNLDYFTFKTRARRWREAGLRAGPAATYVVNSMNRRGDLLQVATQAGGYRVEFADGLTGIAAPPAFVPAGGAGSTNLLSGQLTDRGTQMFLGMTCAYEGSATTGANVCTLFAHVRPAGSSEFEAPFLLGRWVEPLSNPRAVIAEDAQGRIYAAWRGDTDVAFGLVASIRDAGGSWSVVPEILTSTAISINEPLLLPAPGGGMHVVGFTVRSGETTLVDHLHLPTSGWQPSTSINLGAIHNDTKFAVAPNGDLFILYSFRGASSTLPGPFRVIRFNVGASSWSAPLEILSSSMFVAPKITDFKVLSGDRLAFLFFARPSVSIQTFHTGTYNWASGAGSINERLRSGPACIDENGLLNEIHLSLGTPTSTFDHYRSNTLGGTSTLLGNVGRADTATFFGQPTLHCASNGRMRLQLDLLDTTTRSWEWR